MELSHVTTEARTVLAVRERVPFAELTDFFGRAFERTAAALGEAGTFPSGPPVAIYYGDPTDTVDVAAGFPFAGSITPPEGTAVVDLPAGRAVEAIHVGPYDELAKTYDTVAEWMQQEHVTPSSVMWEEYLAGPDTDPDPSTWRTRIVYPIA
jgi:effector-binding domain-containing protein